MLKSDDPVYRECYPYIRRKEDIPLPVLIRLTDPAVINHFLLSARQHEWHLLRCKNQRRVRDRLQYARAVQDLLECKLGLGCARGAHK